MWISLLSSVGSEKKRWLLNQKFKQYALIVLGGSKFIVIEGRDFFFFSCLIDVFVIYIKCTHQQLHCKLFKIQVLHEKIMYNSMATTTMVTHYNLVELSVLLQWRRSSPVTTPGFCIVHVDQHWCWCRWKGSSEPSGSIH